MTQMIINDEQKGLSIEHVFDTISTSLLDIIAGEIELNGSIEGIVENERCSRYYKIYYKDGVRTRFIVGAYMKERL